MQHKPTPQVRYCALRAAGEGEDNRTYDFTISTESRDSYGTVFRLDGWELDAYHKNPIVAYNHHTNSENPDAIIGNSEVFRDGDQLVGRVTLEEGNPIADRVKRKLDNGTLRMASVGASVKEYHRGLEKDGEDTGTIYFTRQELVEWSIVPAGSNKDAHKRNAEALTEIDNAFAKAKQEQQTTGPADPVKRKTSLRDAQLISYKYKHK